MQVSEGICTCKVFNQLKSKIMDREQAWEVLRKMSLQECIEMWNDSVADHYCRAYEIHEMHNDDEWWDYLAKEIGAYQMIRQLLESGESFNLTDKWFFYDQEEEVFKSFSTKQELMELGAEESFIEIIYNREEE